MENEDVQDEKPIDENKKTGFFVFESAPESKTENPLDRSDKKNTPRPKPSDNRYLFQFSALPGFVQGLVVSLLVPLIIFGLIELLFLWVMSTSNGGLSNIGWLALFFLLPLYYGWAQLLITIPLALYMLVIADFDRLKGVLLGIGLNLLLGGFFQYFICGPR